MTIKESINGIQDNIFEYDIVSINENITALTEQLFEVLPNMHEDQVAKLNTILQYMQIGMQNRDYLLVADILQYELNGLIDSIMLS